MEHSGSGSQFSVMKISVCLLSEAIPQIDFLDQTMESKFFSNLDIKQYVCVCMYVYIHKMLESSIIWRNRLEATQPETESTTPP